MANTKPDIFGCVCKHTEQDKLYGQGRRLHNATAKGYRCTVCGRERA